MGWLLLLLLLGAAALGAFSEGPLNRTEAQAGEGELSVQHQRFYRKGASSVIEVGLRGDPSRPETEVLIGSPLLDALSLETIRPNPDRAQAGRDGLLLTFSVPDGGPATVYLGIRPRTIGRVHGAIAVAGTGASVPVRFFVYP